MQTEPDELPEIAFPALNLEEETEAVITRPLPLHELPMHARVNHELKFIAQYYPRVAEGIDIYWGQRDCVEHIQALIVNGYKEGEKRLGFKLEVITALLNLLELHKQEFGP